MSEMRHDPLRDSWVILAPDRGQRPRDIALMPAVVDAGKCPFCPGEEAQTPPEILATGRPAAAAANQPPWRVRVFPNRYPALVPGPVAPLACGALANSLAGHGHHEVVVFTPDHDATLAGLAVAHRQEILMVVQQRLAALEAADGITSVLFFVNAGAGAGATLSHAHGQIIATPVVPAVIRQEMNAMAAWGHSHGGCLICAIVAHDRAAHDRVVLETEHWLVAAPYASRFAWELMLVPRVHAARCAQASVAVITDLARVLGRVLETVSAVLGDYAYNLILHTGPVGRAAGDYHWHLEFMPRLVPMAGFEAGSGFFINPVPAEAAAARLRAILAGASERFEGDSGCGS